MSKKKKITNWTAEQQAEIYKLGDPNYGNPNANLTNFQKLGKWFGKLWNKIVGHGNTASLTDVMDADGNFVYNDTSTGLTKLWNQLTGKTQQDLTIAQNNWNTQYNSPSNQAKLLTESGYNPNLVNSSGLYEATQMPVQAENAWNGLGMLANGVGGISNFFQDRKAKELSNKNLSIKNIADEINLPPLQLKKAITEAMNDPSYVSESVRQLITDLNLKADAQELQNDHNFLDKQQTQLQTIYTAIERAFADADVKDYLEQDPYGDGYRLNTEGHARRKDRKDAEQAEWLIKIAEKVKAQAEEDWSKQEGHNGTYPTWGIDLLDDEMMKHLMTTLDQIGNPTIRGIITGVVYILREKM